MEKVNEKEIENCIKKFIHSDDKNLLIRGYFDIDKLVAVLSSVYNEEEVNQLLLVLGDTSVKDVPRLFNPAFIQPKFKNVKLDTKKYRFPNAEGVFTKWRSHINGVFGAGKDLAIFYPVEGVLFNSNDTDKFKSTLKNSRAKKSILITTNDFSNLTKKLYDSVDEVIIFDSSNANENNKELLKVIHRNFEFDKRELPY
ncbi:hypothetical protein [Pediococcus argentinicus]|uniref:Uncharacterized protein n=1 Tax=Pediococcus argentinicus TaxID=480391 RepID=A0A0R2NGA3_9LACO|nr:hypothetical protein [Pediococcus argentinicus]KRO24865.1 hypothetical protein IV88_GL000694 [Pediococcus argentinicus]NKZ22667.1 hypothetical protein [Pediococcus argentinicus]GEP19693.1 hypothetical protein LSA03_10770 [Pediococcus argentinicus]